MSKGHVYAEKQVGPRRDSAGYQHIATAKLHSIWQQAPYFSITVDSWSPRNTTLSQNSIQACGCQHDVVEKLFPELAPYIKWHLTSTEMPLHYITNTLYHAGDQDYRGLRAGEKRQLVNGRTKLPVWELVVRDSQGNRVNKFSYDSWVDMATCPTDVFTASYEPQWIVGEGKQREFEAARRSAVWPEATDEQLSLPKEELQKLLEDRHPMLMQQFQRDMLELFGEDTWSGWNKGKEDKSNA